MDKLSSETSLNGSASSPMTPTEKRALSEVLSSAKRPGGSYGSLAKSQLQPTLYICHQVETDDTLQRLALKYSVHIQEIKRTNKLWSDAELSLLKAVYIPVNSSQLTALRTSHPTLNIVQNPSPTTNRARRTSTDTGPNDGTTPSMRTFNSTVSMPATTNTSAFQDYFSRIDQQIFSSKRSLQTLDAKAAHLPSQISNGDSNHHNGSPTSQTSRTTVWNNDRHHLSGNIVSRSQREKHVSAALERIQREKDDFDGL